MSILLSESIRKFVLVPINNEDLLYVLWHGQCYGEIVRSRPICGLFIFNEI